MHIPDPGQDVGGAWLGRCSLALVVTVSVTYKNGPVGVVTVACHTRSLHIPDRSVGLFKPPKVQVKQVTNCTLDCVVFSGPGRHGFGNIHKNGSVGVVTVAWRTRSLHIPDRSRVPGQGTTFHSGHG